MAEKYSFRIYELQELRALQPKNQFIENEILIGHKIIMSFTRKLYKIFLLKTLITKFLGIQLWSNNKYFH